MIQTITSNSAILEMGQRTFETMLKRGNIEGEKKKPSKIVYAFEEECFTNILAWKESWKIFISIGDTTVWTLMFDSIVLRKTNFKF